jgi:hypothetical protein
MEAVALEAKMKTFPEVYSRADILKLKSGMALLVRWPDKHFTKEIIRLEKYADSAQIDMNNYPDNFMAQTISAVIIHHGQRVLILCVREH